MGPTRALERIGVFLHVMALGLFLGTIGELFAVKHYGEPIKLLPIALCVIGCLALAAAWLRPSRRGLQSVRGLMVFTLIGSLIGVYEHIQGNLELSQEIHRHMATMARIKAVLTGRNPLAAPGMLAVAALLLIAATYVTEALAKPGAGRAEKGEAEVRKPTPMRAWRSA